MAWVAVDENGDECIYKNKPFRLSGYWYMCDDYFLELPKGSIEKLTGRNLFWSDEPVEV